MVNFHIILLVAALLQYAAATTVLLPLYSYPEGTAWAPLYAALTAQPTISFQVVINPNSGPGGSSPDDAFKTAIAKLQTYKNVQIIGYVRTGYGKRSVADVNTEVDQYAAWKDLMPKGIFFDEVEPTQYNNLAQCTTHARTALGTSSTIIYNPGKVSEESALYDAPDQVVVFEAPYAELAAKSAGLKAITAPKSKLSAIVTAFSGTAQEQTVLASGIFSGFASLYLTQDPATYQHFGDDWMSFCAAMTGLKGPSSTGSASATATKAAPAPVSSTGSAASSGTVSPPASGSGNNDGQVDGTDTEEVSSFTAGSGSVATPTADCQNRHHRHCHPKSS